MKRKEEPYIRWSNRRDYDAMAYIEELAFPGRGLVKADFETLLGNERTIAYVAEYEGDIAGHVVYTTSRLSIAILTLVVDPVHRRHGIGSLLVAKIAAKVRPKCRECVTMHVNERNIDGQKFLAACGFKAVAVLPRWFMGADDAYVFTMDLKTASIVTARRTLVNRIKDFIA